MMSKFLSDIGEFGLIEQIRKQMGQSSAVVQGIGDDTAVLPWSSNKYLLLTTDMLLEGTHFTRKMPAKGIGHKAIAASISDIAAMGGNPKYAVISLGAPPSCPMLFVSQVYQGIKATAKKFHIDIVGGDTVKSNKIIINVALAGEVKKNDVVYRSGARKGDQIFVTGPLGKSLFSGGHLRFIPRIAQAQFLVKNFKPTAMIDISDGLAADLGHIVTESRGGAFLEEKSIPRCKGASLNNSLYDGEDFELLFTLSPLKARKLLLQKRKGFSFYPIGEIVDRRKGLQLKLANGTFKKLKCKGYTHF